MGSAEDIFDSVARCRMAFFVGRNDTGKSTLIRHIADSMDASIIDSDIGQSDIGPPSVIALGERRGARYEMVDGYFCGSTSPARHFLPLIGGAARMAQRVKQFPALVNTTGLATGDIGRMLKTEKINALSPDLIVGMGDGLEYLDAFAGVGAMVVHLPVSPFVRAKSRAERTALRQRSFGEHFRNAKSTIYPFKKFSVERSLLFNGHQGNIADDVLRLDISNNEACAVITDKLKGYKALMNKLGPGVLHVYAPEDFVNVLVGLLDDKGKFLGLGIIEAMDFEGEKIYLYATARQFSVLQFGSIKIDKNDFHYMGPFSGRTYRA